MGNINLVTNPSFETNTTSWTITNASTARDATIITPGIGAFALKLTATSAAKVTATYSATGLTIGQNYTFSFYVRTQPVSTNFSVAPTVAGVFTPAPPIVALDQFQRRYVGFVATATTMVLGAISETNNAIGDIIWIDNVQLTADGLMPYWDGSYPNSSWSGTANGSTSTNNSFSTTLAGSITTDEVLTVNNFALNTLAWNIVTKSGRFTVATTRGDDITLPGVNGRTFVPNKPLDSGLYALSMFILGAYPDGSIPTLAGMQSVFMKNYETLLRNCMSSSAPVTLVSWQPNGGLRTTTATLAGQTAIDPSVVMGGARAEVTLAFDILPGIWRDYASTTVTGTASAAWSNQTLSMPTLADGTAPIDDAVITVTGPITNPTVSNASTGTSVSLTGTVPSGQTWVIDCGAWTSKVNGVSQLLNTTHAGHPRFLVIDPVSPTVSVTGSSTSAVTNISVTAYRKHLIG